MNTIYYRITAATESSSEIVNSIPSENSNTETVAGTETHTTESTGHSKEKSEGISALGLDPIAIGAQTLTFLVLFWVVKKYALDGIVKNLDKRHNDINRGLHLTAELDKQKAELDTRVESLLKSARKEADAIIAEAHAETGRMIATAEESASNKADAILRDAEGKIERDIVEARNGLKKEMADLITEATESILGEKLNATADRKLIEEYLKGASK